MTDNGNRDTADGKDLQSLQDIKPAEDPGQLEGKEKPQSVQTKEPAADHPRFKEIYGKWKDSERQLNELSGSFNEFKTQSTSKEKMFQEHNAKLADALEKINNVPKEQPRQDDTVNQISNLQSQLSKAYDEADWSQVANLQSQISGLQIKTAMSAFKVPDIDGALNKFKEEFKTEKASDNQTIQDDVVYQNWKTQNAWYKENPETEQDEMLYGIAFSVASRERQKGKSFQDSLNEAAKKVKKMMDSPKTANMFSPVESGVGKPLDVGSGAPSAEDVKMAKNFGIPVERWMAQKKLTQGDKK